MGMTIGYIAVNSEVKERLEQQGPENLFELLNELENESEEDVCYLDKMWDGLHCLLTGESAVRPQEGNLLSEAVMGTGPLTEEAEDFPVVLYIDAERLPKVLAAMEELDEAQLKASFDPKLFAEKNIYPDVIWMRDDREQLAEELTICFRELRNFYKKVAERNKHIIISIF